MTSALIVRVPEAESAVRPWSARPDVPAHVTVLHPFLPAARLDADVLSGLSELIGAHRKFDVRFATCGRFPGVLHLLPDPAAPFLALTRAVAERWPEAPPFAGAFTLDELVAHLTVAESPDPAVLAEAEAAVTPLLPIHSRVAAVDLLVHDGERWQPYASFPLH
ncbi:2'-5' RNA ligase family protein [Kitasatospora aureofaciens]|uniref:2'-5' RNA ligase family protein n=1 Tax=Kitasatospora aureofaciens TaxID=1894 RepID=UPI001C474C48|nr:2'-5' RNA ligase family protein [Kitasatospora aureofaciens]MBV6702139.1 2'-5' RNA ligase family protein [Kitasatospora aureofaciens]